MGICDTEHWCNLCYEHSSSCALCVNEPTQKVVPVPDHIKKKWREEELEAHEDARISALNRYSF